MFLINSPDIQILRKYFQIFSLGAANIQFGSFSLFSHSFEIRFLSQPLVAACLIGCLSNAGRENSDQGFICPDLKSDFLDIIFPCRERIKEGANILG